MKRVTLDFTLFKKILAVLFQLTIVFWLKNRETTREMVRSPVNFRKENDAVCSFLSWRSFSSNRIIKCTKNSCLVWKICNHVTFISEQSTNPGFSSPRESEEPFYCSKYYTTGAVVHCFPSIFEPLTTSSIPYVSTVGYVLWYCVRSKIQTSITF